MLLLWAAAFVLYIRLNGDYPDLPLLTVAGILGILWLAGLAIGGRVWRRHPLLIWLLPVVWFASYFPGLIAGCAVAVGSNCDWGQGATVSQGTTGGHAYAGIRVEANAQTVSLIGGNIWLPDVEGSKIWTYAGLTGHPSFAINTPSSPFQVISDGSVLWLSSANGWVSKLDSASHREVHREHVGGEPLFLSVNNAAVWVVDPKGGRLLSLDRRSGRLVKTINTESRPNSIVALDDSLWFADSEADYVVRRDPVDGHVVANITTGEGPGYVAAAFSSLWVTNQNGEPGLTRIDPVTNTVVSRISVGEAPISVTQVGQELWVANGQSKTISVVDPATNSVTGTLRLPVSPWAIAAGNGVAWVATYQARELLRIDLNRR